jgi:CO/xanthine dehydrogenase Mo-binding subunit
MLAGTGLCLSIGPRKLFALSAAPKGFRPSAYLMITPDDRVMVWVTRSEMGQGVRTVLPILVAEELEVSLSEVKLQQATMTPEFKGIRLRTSGSGSAVGTWKVLRQAGATARVMLIQAAAQQWGVPTESCQAEAGAVVHTQSGRSLRYGELVERAAALPVPTEVPLKPPTQFKLIGKPHKRKDGQSIVTGKAVYGIDVKREGMKYAAVVRSPVLKGKVRKFDTAKARGIPGVVDVVPVAAGLSNGVAVIANSTWAAFQGASRLEIEWDPGEQENFSTDNLYRQYREALDREGLLVRNEGDPIVNGRKFEAEYEWPYQVHAPMEPMNCTVHVQNGRCEMWVPTQAPEQAQKLAAELLGIPPESVVVNITMLGGGFGRRLFVDYVQEAVAIGKAVKCPVQLVWTREDDMRFGFLNPPSFSRFTATVGEKGEISVVHRAVSSDMSMLDPHEHTGKAYAEDGWLWGAWDNPYQFQSLRYEYTPIDSPVPTGPWRAVMYPGTVFARESFLDELARELKRDPIDLRLQCLKPEKLKLNNEVIDRGRLATVLQVAAERSGWDKPLSSKNGRRYGRGIACNVYDSESFIAHVAEVSVGNKGDLKVERVVIVADMGQVINPLGVEGQAESAAVWALTSTLKSTMEFRNGRAMSSNFSDYQLLTMAEMPRIETHLLPSTERPSGFGEHGVPGVAPAVANAIFAATGRRVRRLPIRDSDLA